MFPRLFQSSLTRALPRGLSVIMKPRPILCTHRNTCTHIVGSPLPAIDLPTSTLYEHVYRDFPKHGPKIALVDGMTGREFSYNELDEMTAKFSSGLKRLGFQEGDVLAIVSPNSPHYPVVMFGTLAMGGIVSTCNPTYTKDELTFQFENSNAKVVATVPAILSTVRAAAEKAGVKTIVVIDDSDQSGSTSDDLIAYNSLIRDSGSLFSHTPQPLNSTALLPYSSGTTGLPKGVMLSHRNVVSNICQMEHDELFVLSRGGTSLIGVLPFFHIYGMVVILFSSLRSGSHTIVLPKFEPELFLSSIQQYRINLAHLVPPLVLFLAKHPDVDKYDLSSLDEIMSGAAPLGGETVSAARERIKCKLIRQGYGLTETSPVTHVMPRSFGMSKPDSIGHLIRSVSAKVVDLESGAELPAHKEGEILISGPNVMKGYLNRPDATRDCLTNDGWFSTGDIGELTASVCVCVQCHLCTNNNACICTGYYDNDGCFYITDRLKELIKVKGLQVAPAELEAVLVTHPQIADAAVVGIPNERQGEAPKAFVVKKDDGLTENEVVQFVASKVRLLFVAVWTLVHQWK